MSEIAIYQPRGELIPVAASPRGELDDWIQVADQVVRLAEVICRSPFVPEGLRGSAPATAAAILTGRELGLPPMTSLANIHVIHGKPGLSAMVMRALIQAQGHEWVDVEVTNTRVVVKGRRKGQAEWTTASFSTADAQTAKLQLGGYPQDKLYARASARLARRAFADVIAGMPYAAEEIEDGIADEDSPAALAAEGTASTPPPAPDKPRTAQRASRRPAAAAPAAAPAPANAQAAPSGDLPPLPGEEGDVPTNGGAATSDTAQPNGGDSKPDESDYDTPGTVTDPQVKRIWTTLRADYGFGKDETDKARAVCAHIVNHDLASSKNLSFREAGTVIDTLANWSEVAGRNQMTPRQFLDDVLGEATVEEVPGE